MARHAWLGIGMVLLCVGSGCTAQGPLVRAGASPSSAPPTLAPSPEVSPSPPAPTPSAPPAPDTPSISCSTVPTADLEPLVLAKTSDYQQVLLESFHDPTHPTALCTMTNAGRVKFISRTEIGYATSVASYDPNSQFSLIGRINLTDLKPIPVLKAEGQVMDVAWSPDGSSVAYLLYTSAPGLGSGSANQLWLKIGNAPPRALTPPIPLFGRDVFLDDQILVGFSPDGKYVLMVDTYVAGGAPSPEQAPFQVRAVQDGSLVWAAPAALHPTGKGQFATMAAWLRQADRIYYREPAGVQTWNPPSTNATAFVGLAWYSPSISPDDRLVAYTVNLEAQPHVEVRELASKAFRVIPGIRGAPFFVGDGMLFVAEYAPSTQPGAMRPYSQTGRAFIFDLRTNVETQLPAIINPIDYWPH